MPTRFNHDQSASEGASSLLENSAAKLQAEGSAFVQPVHVAHLTDVLSPGLGGVESALAKLSRSTRALRLVSVQSPTRYPRRLLVHVAPEPQRFDPGGGRTCRYSVYGRTKLEMPRDRWVGGWRARCYPLNDKMHTFAKPVIPPPETFHARDGNRGTG